MRSSKYIKEPVTWTWETPTGGHLLKNPLFFSRENEEIFLENSYKVSFIGKRRKSLNFYRTKGSLEKNL